MHITIALIVMSLHTFLKAGLIPIVPGMRLGVVIYRGNSSPLDETHEGYLLFRHLRVVIPILCSHMSPIRPTLSHTRNIGFRLLRQGNQLVLYCNFLNLSWQVTSWIKMEHKADKE